MAIEFFSQEHLILGDKTSLAQQIHEITGIPHAPLEDTSLARFTVDDRHTKLEEDGAYSLLGLLDV